MRKEWGMGNFAGASFWTVVISRLGTNRLIHLHEYILTPLVMYSLQPPVLH